MRLKSILFSLSCVLTVVGPGRTYAGVRDEVGDAKFICPTDPGEIWLWFDLNAGQVFRRWSGVDFIKLKWTGDRVEIAGPDDQDGPFYFERTKAGYAYGGFACRRVNKLPIETLKKEDFAQ